MIEKRSITRAELPSAAGHVKGTRLTPTFKDRAGLGRKLKSVHHLGHGCKQLENNRSKAAFKQAKPTDSHPRTPTMMMISRQKGSTLELDFHATMNHPENGRLVIFMCILPESPIVFMATWPESTPLHGKLVGGKVAPSEGNIGARHTRKSNLLHGPLTT